MHIPWGDLQMLVAVSEAGSVSAAAKKLRVTQPTVSRRLADLEATLGEPLFTRSVEGVALTAFGERMIVPARAMAENVAEAERVAANAEVSPKGIVRITAPPGVAGEIVAPFAAYLRHALPEIRLEVIAAVKHLDVARREADLALRSDPVDRPLKQRDVVLLASRVCPVRAFATPAYLESLPRPCRIGDVDWIGWPPHLDHVAPNPHLAAHIPGFRPIFTADDYLVQIRAAEAGLGAVFLYNLPFRWALPTPLARLPLSFGKQTSSLHLITSRAALSIPRVKAVADLLVRELKEQNQSRPKKQSESMPERPRARKS